MDPFTLLTLASAGLSLGQTVLGSKQENEGFKLQAGGYRQAANATLAAAEYNNQIAEINTQRRLEAMGRQMKRIGAEQRVAAVSSGFASSSKSKLAVMDATLDQFSRQIRDEAASLSHQQQANLFEAQSEATALETRARTVEFEAKQRKREQKKQMFSAGGNFLNILGGSF